MALENVVDETIIDPEFKRLKRLERLGREKVKIVHLGNVGFGGLEGHYNEFNAAKTNKYSNLFPNYEFYGIDLEDYTSENYEQIKGQFDEGLKQFKNNSLDIISSDMAVGHSDFTDFLSYKKFDSYHSKLFNIINSKLKEDGIFYISMSSEYNVYSIISNLRSANFNVEQRDFKENEFSRTYWTSQFKDRDEALVQITARKKRKN